MRVLALALAIICGATPVARAGLLVYTGTTTGGPTWQRPLEGSPPTALSSGATNVPYHAYSFDVTWAAEFDFVSEVDGPWDHFTFLYQDAFDPLNPLSNVLIGNEAISGTGGLQSGFFDVWLDPGQYFFVTTGSNNFEYGDFTNTITSSSTIPEPSSLALLGLMMSGAFALGRRRARTKQRAESDRVET